MRDKLAVPWAVAAVSALLALGGCGDDDTTSPTSSARSKHSATTHPPAETDQAPKLHPPPCPPGIDPCVRAAGTILYVERVDPDGDGDAHFVLADSRGVTGPGITVLDVRTDLRPHPLPGPGDEIGGAGPVQSGSFGQH